MITTLLYQFIVVFIATAAFSILFSVPAKQYLFCGLVSAFGFVCYSAVHLRGGSQVLASLIGAIALTLLTRVFSKIRCCPSTIFITTGIFPLVPGLDIYRAAYYIMIGDNQLFVYHGLLALKIAVAIAVGMIIIFTLPAQLFHLSLHRSAKTET